MSISLGAVRARTRTVVLAIMLPALPMALGCSPATPRPIVQPVQSSSAPPVASADNAHGASTASSSPPPAHLSTPEERASEIGPLHVPLVHAGERTFAVIGSPAMALALWDVGAQPASRVGLFPLGVRVIGNAMVQTHPCFLLESVRFDDQPAGLRSVRCVSDDGFSPVRELSNVANAEELAHETFPDADSESSLGDFDWGAMLQRASRSGGALAHEISPHGAAFVRVWQDELEETVEPLTPATAARARNLSRILAILRRGARTAREADMPEPSEFVALGRSLERRVITSIYERAEPQRAPVTAGPPHAVPASPLDPEFARRVHAIEPSVTRILAQAPLGADGTIGVAVIDDGAKIVIEEQGATFVNTSLTRGALPADVRFGDIDGDGVTDVLLWYAAGDPHALVLITPRTPTAEDTVDHGYSFAALGATDADRALALALAPPTGHVTPAETCALFRGANSQAGLRRVMTDDGRIVDRVTEAEPAVSVRDATETDWSSVGRSCALLRCSDRILYCEMPNSEYGHPVADFGGYLFTRDGGRLRLRVYYHDR